MPKSDRRLIQGAYFPYCQLCAHDGACQLKHCEFMGAPEGAGVDATPYAGHEELWWSHTAFQVGSTRRACTGRIQATDNIFYPLQCECGTVVSSLGLMHGGCHKMLPNEKGLERIRLIEHIADAWGVSVSHVSPDDLPPLDDNYYAVMRR